MRKIIFLACAFLLFGTNTFLQAQEKQATASDYINEGNHLLFYGKYLDATQLFQKALKISEETQDFLHIAASYNALAKAFFSQSQLMQSYSYAQQALVYSEKAKEVGKREKATALENLATIESIIGKPKEALKNALEALEIRQTHFKEEKLALVNSYLNYAIALHTNRKLPEAVENLDIAISITTEKSPQLTILHADIMELKGQIKYDLGENGEALSYFEKTLQLAQQVYEKEHPYFGKVYNEIGLIYSIREEFGESLEYYKKALSLSIQNYGIDNHDEQVRIHFNIGTVYFNQNLIEKALFHTKKTLELGTHFYGASHPKMFFPYSQLGNIYGDERGIPYLEKALAISLNAPKVNYVIVSYLYEYLGHINYRIEDLQQALHYYQKSLEIRERIYGTQNTSTIKIYNNIAKIYTGLQNFEEALAYNQKAIQGNQLVQITDTNRFSAKSYVDTDMPLENTKTKADILLHLYENTKDKKYLEESIQYYTEAISLIKLTRSSKRNYADKIKFSETIKALYAKNIYTSLAHYELYQDDSSLRTAFTASEQSKAHVLRSLLKNTEQKRQIHLHEDILNLEKNINDELAVLQSKILVESTKKDADSILLYTLEGAFFDLSKRKDSLEKSIEHTLPKYYKLKYEDRVITLQNLQEKLNDQTTLLEFFKNHNMLYVFIVTKNTFRVEKLEIEDLDNQINEFNNAIVQKDTKKFTKHSVHLYKQLLAPIRNYFVGDELLIIPDESLWHLQFDLLLTQESNTDTDAYLLHNYAISYANSASLLFESAESKNVESIQNDCIAFSFTSKDSIHTISSAISLSDLRNSQIDLPGTRKEITEISKILEGSYFYGTKANEANFKEQAAKFKIIHLALHGDIDNQNSNNLKIYFSKGSDEEDDTLFVHELYNLHIPASLVVLSACNTGSGKVNKAEGIQSLGNAFQYAGAKSLLLSRWEISDKTTPEFMSYFYKHIKAGLPKHKALQQAKIDFLAQTDSFTNAPFYWGSFYVLGDTQPIVFSLFNYTYWIIGIVLGALLLLVFIYRKRKHLQSTI